MRYVIIRDDDTNALTPVECLEKLYRPFLDRGLPVNLAVIPAVNTGATTAEGRREGFLSAAPEHGKPRTSRNVPMAENPALARYLISEPGYSAVQHGCHHDFLEFDNPDAADVTARLDRGARFLREAGFLPSQTFVAPYDKLSRVSLGQVARRFRVLSTGWFELRRLPYAWWPGYVLKKVRKAGHWRAGRAWLLSHPGCLLSCHRPVDSILPAIRGHVERARLTVLVTHWWEYFRDDRANGPLIKVLHQTANYLASQPDLKVITFSDLAEDRVRLN